MFAGWAPGTADDRVYPELPVLVLVGGCWLAQGWNVSSGLAFDAALALLAVGSWKRMDAPEE